MARKERKGHKVPWEIPGPSEFQDLRVPRDPRVLMGHKVRKGRRELPG